MYGINKRILLDVFEARGQEFVDTLNLSLSSGIFSDKWKTSTLTPIKKVSNSNNASEFRPINQMYEKILEIVIKPQLEEYLTNNDILIKGQSGFYAKYLCETAL